MLMLLTLVKDNDGTMKIRKLAAVIRENKTEKNVIKLEGMG